MCVLSFPFRTPIIRIVFVQGQVQQKSDEGKNWPPCERLFSPSLSFNWFGSSRIVDPIDQCLAHIRTPRYKDHPGKLYTVFRKMRVYDSDLRLMVDALEMKTGYAVDIVRRQEQYHDLCDPVDFIWLYEYDCDSVKLIERLVHLTLRARGGTIKPYPCPGCGTRHREFFLESAAGGVDGMCAIIEFWLGAMGQPIVRSVVQPIPNYMPNMVLRYTSAFTTALPAGSGKTLREAGFRSLVGIEYSVQGVGYNQ
ncbi:hypothetical protein DFH06DRAFT_1149806 [Mycena polygramma]|nr:hypothetical protein DFH06DRAFT_1149806 [Mycena polygramma]